MRAVCKLHLDVRGVSSEFYVPYRAPARMPTDRREAGLHQVEASDDAPTHLHPQACPDCIPRGGCRWLLSRAMDPLDDHLIRPCVPLVLLDFITSPIFWLAGAASFTIYTRTKEYFRDRHWLANDRIFHVSAVGGIRYVECCVLTLL